MTKLSKLGDDNFRSSSHFLPHVPESSQCHGAFDG